MNFPVIPPKGSKATVREAASDAETLMLLRESYGALTTFVTSEIARHSDFEYWRLNPPRNADDGRACLAMIDALPDSATFERLRSEARQAAFGVTDRETGALIIGASVSSMLPGAANLAALAISVLDAIDYEEPAEDDRRANFKGYTPPVVLLAATRLRRAHRFAPPVCDWVDALNQARRQFAQVARNRFAGLENSETVNEIYRRALWALPQEEMAARVDDDIEF